MEHRKYCTELSKDNPKANNHTYFYWFLYNNKNGKKNTQKKRKYQKHTNLVQSEKMNHGKLSKKPQNLKWVLQTVQKKLLRYFHYKNYSIIIIII